MLGRNQSSKDQLTPQQLAAGQQAFKDAVGRHQRRADRAANKPTAKLRREVEAEREAG